MNWEINKELTDLHPILSPLSLNKYEKLAVPHSINDLKPLILRERDRIGITL